MAFPSFTEKEIIGYSVDGRPLTAVRIGQGDRVLVIVGSLHGGHECNTGTLLAELQARLVANPAHLPPAVRLYILPVVNPDGCQLGTRENGHQVDLNRNWDTPNWTADAAGPQGLRAGSGGTKPFSEPETRALRDWLLALKSQPHKGRLHLISYHSAVPPTGLVLPGYGTPGRPQPASRKLAELYTTASGYPYSATWIGNYEITGELIHWAVLQDLVAIDVELPTRARLEDLPPDALEALVDANLAAWLAVTVHLNTPSSRTRRSG